MKRVNLIWVVLVVSLILSSCGKENVSTEDNSVPTEDNNINNVVSRNKEDDKIVTIGTYQSGEPEVVLPYEVVDSLYKWYFRTSDVQMHQYSIFDNPEIEKAVVYMIIEGYDIITNESRIVGFELNRDKRNKTYYAYSNGSSSSSASWSCTGVNCNGCSPRRKWFLGRVVGCDCTGKPIHAGEESGCNHSCSGGNGGQWVKTLADILIAFF